MNNEKGLADSVYKELSKERKRLQAEGKIPEWASTGGWQMFKGKYLWGTDSWRGQYERIAKTLARHTIDPVYWEKKFFDILWNNILSPSTPVLANTGTDRGMVISCSGQYVSDNVHDFYDNSVRMAVLSQEGFGTSAYLGDIRPRGTPISRGGKASGALPVLNMLVQVCKDISQGGVRRGSTGLYYDLSGGDFWEILKDLEANPDDKNIGWCWYDSDTAKMNAGDEETLHRWQEALRVKLTLGKGYFFFPDKVNRHRPQCYKDLGLEVHASNLCTEIALHSSPEYDFTCCLSSLNLVHWDIIESTDAVEVAIYFLDCVVSEFLEKARGIKGLEKAVAFTEKGRALGLGAMGLFSLFMEKRINAVGFEGRMLNNHIFRTIRARAEKMTAQLAEWHGEPEWCKGYGRRNTHLMAIAPTKSTAQIMGGWSEGIGPQIGMVFTADGAAGQIDRIDPTLLKLMKERGAFNKENVDVIITNGGSVSKSDWLTDEEKKVFRNAFEYDQNDLIDLAAGRQPHIDQGQSLNLHFTHEDTEEYISAVHSKAFQCEMNHSLYYIHSTKEVKAQRTSECEACM